jgi:hypothetical protein
VSWGYPNASRYIRKFQSRRSLLVWKIFGERLDGFTNDDHPSESKPGSGVLTLKGQDVDPKTNRHHYDLDYLPPMMPPPDAVKAGKVAPLSDEDKRAIVRWIDLGCPIDLDFDFKNPSRTGYGWMLDEQRPTLALTFPAPGADAELSRILIGFADYGSGLDERTLSVTADFAIDDIATGQNLASKLRSTGQGIWEYRLERSITSLPRGMLTITVADRQGNVARIERTIRIGSK